MNYSSRVGQNRRFQLVERDVERAGQTADRAPRPVSLTIDQVTGTRRRVDASDPVPVTAWVPHQVAYVEALPIDAEAIAWTQRAVLIRWTQPGASYPTHAWLWAHAVSRRADH